MPNFWFANASSYAKFVKLLQDISMTSQFHRNFFAVLVWQIIWSESCDCLFWESFSPLCNILSLLLKQTFQWIIWIFTEGEGYGIESRLPFKIFSPLYWKDIINLYYKIVPFFQRFFNFLMYLSTGCGYELLNIRLKYCKKW